MLDRIDLGKTAGMHSICPVAKQEIDAHVKRNKENPELARAQVSCFKAKYDVLMSRPPAPDFDCSCLFDEARLLDVIARAAEEYPGSIHRHAFRFDNRAPTLFAAAAVRRRLRSEEF